MEKKASQNNLLFNKPSISAIFPCFNDAKSIGGLIKNTNNLLRKSTKDYEIIVVEDASKDNSREVLKKLSRRYKRLKVFYHKKNKGYGATLRSGFKKAAKNLIFYTDGDGQYDPKELPLLLSLMTDDINFVNGIKMPRHDPTYRIIIGNIYSFLARWTFWLPIFDVDCDFRLIRRSLLRKIKLKKNSGTICIELVKKAQKAGAKFRQVSVHHYERPFGQSQFFQPKHLLTTFAELFSLWFEVMGLSLS